MKELQKNLQILDSITGKLQSEKSSPEQHLPAFPSYQLQPHQNNNNTDFHGMAQSYRESPLL